jgi:hypothetical protein
MALSAPMAWPATPARRQTVRRVLAAGASLLLLAHTPAVDAQAAPWWQGFGDAQLNRLMPVVQGLADQEAAVFNQLLIVRTSAVRLAIGHEMLKLIDREESWLLSPQGGLPEAEPHAARLHHQRLQLWAVMQRLQQEGDVARSGIQRLINGTGRALVEPLDDAAGGLLTYQPDAAHTTGQDAPGTPREDPMASLAQYEQLRQARTAEQSAQRLLLASRMQWEASRIRYEAGQQHLIPTLQDHLQLLLQADEHAVATARLALAWQQVLQTARPAAGRPVSHQMTR